jgi:hypothetical protein
MKIAIIGWGSLLWDEYEQFDSKHGEWIVNGPLLPLEFSRISRSRGGILTPVIDINHGRSSPTAYSISTRVDFMDTVCDLRQREGCLYKYISWITIDGPHNVGGLSILSIYVPVYEWMESNRIDVAVWTGIQPNFQRVTGNIFSIPAAMRYLGGLSFRSQMELREYMKNLPKFVTTPLLEHIKSHL